VYGLIALLSATCPAWAQSIPEFPGWRLDPVETTQIGTPTDLEYTDFFTLVPTGGRPPITVDGGTAARLFHGQANPETIYSERMAGPADKIKNDSSGGSGGAVGWQIAESTYVPVGEEKSRNPATAVTGSSTLGGTAGLSGANAGGMGANAAGGSGTGTMAGFGSGTMAGAAVGGTAMTFASPNGGFSSHSNSFSGGTAGKSPAYNGTTGAGAGSGAVDTSNMTYSQMIESANSAAMKSACARMGSYAQGGFCK
jgi:hypothetical protein